MLPDMHMTLDIATVSFTVQNYTSEALFALHLYRYQHSFSSNVEAVVGSHLRALYIPGLRDAMAAGKWMLIACIKAAAGWLLLADVNTS